MRLTRFLTQLISETGGLSLDDTLALAEQSPSCGEELAQIRDFRELLGRFRLNQSPLEPLLEHPVSLALEGFFRAFPIPFRDEHIHLTGSLGAEFVYPRLQRLLDGPQRALYESKSPSVWPRESAHPERRRRGPSHRLAEGEHSIAISRSLLRSSFSSTARRTTTPRITWPAVSGAPRTSARCG